MKNLNTFIFTQTHRQTKTHRYTQIHTHTQKPIHTQTHIDCIHRPFRLWNCHPWSSPSNHLCFLVVVPSLFVAMTTSLDCGSCCCASCSSCCCCCAEPVCLACGSRVLFLVVGVVFVVLCFCSVVDGVAFLIGLLLLLLLK